ncbi:threonine--tRNA ligase, mitochondrial isoform 2-T2 [Cyanocitta cristata]
MRLRRGEDGVAEPGPCSGGRGGASAMAARAGPRLLLAGAPRRHRVSGPDPERLRLFQRLRAAAAAAERWDGPGDGAGGGAGGGRLPPGTPIRIALPGGRRLPGRALQTTPFQVATELGAGLAEAALVARVNGTLQDLDRPLECDTDLELLDFSTPEGREHPGHRGRLLLRRAHGQQDRAERGAAGAGGGLCHVRPCPTPLRAPRGHPPAAGRAPPAQQIPAGAARGGDIPHGHGLQSSAALWGGAGGRSLQRVAAVAFPSAQELEQWERAQDEAAQRDHRRIGKDQELFFFHKFSPGSCFFLPRGAHVYNALVEFIRSEYRARGFSEVVTPNLFSPQLWELSGHWQHYSPHIFSVPATPETLSLKPMNCPAHCLMFAHRPRSWRELPLRLADFGVLHRNEPPGTLTGLTRVRRFQQDDAHIFCTLEQLESEIDSSLDFIRTVYAVLGFSFRLALATRPDGFLGDPETWDRAEQQLERSLQNFGQPWELSPGDGAFYGPKIDIQIRDALGRQHQCGTIQLDFQMPERFELEYASPSGGPARPVLVHRAVLGSVERMVAVLAESCGGRWPLWLSPLQAVVIPQTPEVEDYAREVQAVLRRGGLMADLDGDPGTTLARKIRRAQLAHYNFQLVVGRRERERGTVSVRTRENRQLGELELPRVLRRLRELRDGRVPDAERRF